MQEKSVQDLIDLEKRKSVESEVSESTLNDAIDECRRVSIKLEETQAKYDATLYEKVKAWGCRCTGKVKAFIGKFKK